MAQKTPCVSRKGDEAPCYAKAKGIITIEGQRISAIDEYRDDEKDVVYLDDDCVIFPGLLELHSHVEYNFDPRKQYETIFRNDDVSRMVGARMIIAKAKDVRYTSMLDLNNLIIRIEDEPKESNATL